ncbi:DUF397 domain-containing protein [Saccharothrix coeruleofusca]|uniref:DUF397 domain-containing protein n=1 Tax=Saccharothrix coeruleofusca TaxID=33919 RepID=A0A918EBJ2_9PSEU|nr:DUF397 domain-containing protein [Saccharothrix coeruleofusca]GGP41497.1 hypothetical protein GCM10010185_10870 [Saccharothrix coeruleofusca]
MPDQRWRKSSYSSSNAECVELLVGLGYTAVRDTKNRDAGTLSFSRAAFAAFLVGVKKG